MLTLKFTCDFFSFTETLLKYINSLRYEAYDMTCMYVVPQDSSSIIQQSTDNLCSVNSFQSWIKSNSLSRTIFLTSITFLITCRLVVKKHLTEIDQITIVFSKK